MLRLTTMLCLISFATLAVMHVIGLRFELYWVLWWFDLPMHFFGGVVVALGLYTLRDIRFPVPSRLYTAVYFVLAVFAIAVGWEVFEYVAAPSLPPDYVVDTVIDLVLGTVGGLLGYGIGKRIATLDV